MAFFPELLDEKISLLACIANASHTDYVKECEIKEAQETLSHLANFHFVSFKATLKNFQELSFLLAKQRRNTKLKAQVLIVDRVNAPSRVPVLLQQLIYSRQYLSLLKHTKKIVHLWRRVQQAFVYQFPYDFRQFTQNGFTFLLGSQCDFDVKIGLPQAQHFGRLIFNDVKNYRVRNVPFEQGSNHYIRRWDMFILNCKVYTLQNLVIQAVFGNESEGLLLILAFYCYISILIFAALYTGLLVYSQSELSLDAVDIHVGLLLRLIVKLLLFGSWLLLDLLFF